MLSALASSENVKELAKRIRNGKLKQLKADGLCGSSATLVLASIANSKAGCPNLLVVMNDLDDAGYAYHDLTQMMGDERVLFFPSSYKRSIKYNQKDAGNEILRTEVLTKLSTLNSQLSTPNPQLSTLNSQLSSLLTQMPLPNVWCRKRSWMRTR